MVAVIRRDRIRSRRMGCTGILAILVLVVNTLWTPSFDRDSFYDIVKRRVAALASYDTSTTELPSFTGNFANVWEPMQDTDTAFFWYIANAGGQVFSKIGAECLNLVSASSRGIPTTSDSLGIYRHTTDGGLFLNVDTGTHEGIDMANDMGVVSSDLADVYMSQHLVYSQKLFNETYKARLFTMIRHPTKRIIDHFYYRQRATWDPNFDRELALMSLSQYAYSDKMVPNFMVRSLVELTNDVKVTPEHVTLAKDILRQKFLVGIHAWFDQSIIRFEKYFGWYLAKNVGVNRTVNYCHYRKIKDGSINGRHIHWGSNTEVFKRIQARNWADVELYVYAKRLFVQQDQLVSDRPVERAAPEANETVSLTPEGANEAVNTGQETVSLEPEGDNGAVNTGQETVSLTPEGDNGAVNTDGQDDSSNNNGNNKNKEKNTNNKNKEKNTNNKNKEKNTNNKNKNKI